MPGAWEHTPAKTKLIATPRYFPKSCAQFPLAGTRVRGYRADVSAVADGDHAFIHITLKIGVGRDQAVKEV